jgi:hypothetical protein
VRIVTQPRAPTAPEKEGYEKDRQERRAILAGGPRRMRCDESQRQTLETETRKELTPDFGCSRLDPGQTRPESLQDRFQGVDAGPIRQLARVITLVE